MTDEPSKRPFEDALADILTPLAVAMVARGVTLGSATEALKRAMLAAVERDGEDTKTDSRIALLTGLHRKDVRRLRAESEPSTARKSLNFSALVVGYWLSASEYLTAGGHPRDLHREASADGPGFDDLIRQTRIDAAPGTVVQALLDQEVVTETEDGRFRLSEHAYVPAADSEELDAAFRATLAAHLETAVHNLLATGEDPRHFDRIVRYSHLSDAAVDELEAHASRSAQRMLEDLNTKARALQERDAETGGKGRFTAGAFVTPEKSGRKSK